MLTRSQSSSLMLGGYQDKRLDGKWHDWHCLPCQWPLIVKDCPLVSRLNSVRQSTHSLRSRRLCAPRRRPLQVQCRALVGRLCQSVHNCVAALPRACATLLLPSPAPVRRAVLGKPPMHHMAGSAASAEWRQDSEGSFESSSTYIAHGDLEISPHGEQSIPQLACL